MLGNRLARSCSVVCHISDSHCAFTVDGIYGIDYARNCVATYVDHSIKVEKSSVVSATELTAFRFEWNHADILPHGRARITMTP
jgi:hypothetical protein